MRRGRWINNNLVLKNVKNKYIYFPNAVVYNKKGNKYVLLIDKRDMDLVWKREEKRLGGTEDLRNKKQRERDRQERDKGRFCKTAVKIHYFDRWLYTKYRAKPDCDKEKLHIDESFNFEIITRIFYRFIRTFTLNFY